MENKIGSTVVFIPVRGGSKSIPLKNIRLINGRPLVYWTLDAAVLCKEVDKVVVSTDSKDIRKAVHNYDSDKIIIIDRSEAVSTDTASTESAMLEFALKYDFEDIILVQATSPMLTCHDISRGMEKFRQKGIDSVLSVVRQKRFIWSESSGKAYAANYDPLKRPRRQEFEGFLVENGAFYITSKKRLLDTHCRISGNTGLVEMDDKTYFEIDEPADWIIAEGLLKSSRGIKSDKNNRIRKIKCLLTDSDGVLTDGGMYYSENGDELKKFNTKDGMGFKLLRERGFLTGIITGESVEIVRRRAQKMKLDLVYLGVQNKMKVIDEICEKLNLKYDEIAYIGDDINDLEVIKSVGFGCTVSDAMQCVKEAALYITRLNGGQGAVREVVELILDVRGSEYEL